MSYASSSHNIYAFRQDSYAIALKGDFQFISSTSGRVKTIQYNYYHGPFYEYQMENMVPLYRY